MRDAQAYVRAAVYVLIIFFANQVDVALIFVFYSPYTVPHADDEKQRGALLIAITRTFS